VTSEPYPTHSTQDAYDLLVDSDTRVPSDCLLDACSEMEASPEVGIMQFSSGVMQVVNTYFENG
jgi:membrane glycosyltransferase